MPVRVLTKTEADQMGLTPRKPENSAAARINPHVQELAQSMKGIKPGQYVLYEPSDGKGPQTQTQRVRQAFTLLGRPWPQVRTINHGKASAIRVLTKQESLERYPKQPLAKSGSQPVPEERPVKTKTARKAPSKSSRRRR